MLSARISLTTTSRIWRCSLVRGLGSSSPKDSTEFPNPPLNLDPSLQDLLKDVDISLLKYKGHKVQPLHELEVIPENLSVDVDAGDSSLHQVEQEEDTFRKSPAARFGSRAVSTAILPQQLQSAINLLINDTDKSQLHSDAKRLFYEENSETGQPGEWEAQYDKKYRSRRQAERHGERDGAAFVSVALPAHFSAIFSVFEHLKRRLDATWQPNQVIEWGSGTGSGLWASLYSFQKASSADVSEPQQLEISESSVKTYVGIDKREGLVAIGKRLFRNIELGGLSMSWQKSFKTEDKITREEGWNTVALSAFMLSTLPTSLAKKALAKEMWESGAHTMVFIDHNTVAGFEAIAHVREYLLKMGRLETEDPGTVDWPIKGSHVVAPCPHDKTCPLLQTGSKLVCGFSQRVQRPSFVRLTKHSNFGHEDIEYSYVVIQRGSRPALPTLSVGRVGEIGRQALHKDILTQMPMKELTLHDEHDADVPADLSVATSTDIARVNDASPTPLELLAALRLEAYHWPRLIFPPLKRSGHIILDSCTTEGKIMRMTIPKSQGKQEYYDARKSNWGDIFPHPPKNPPQVRDIPCNTKRGLDSAVAGSDIGKRSRSGKPKDRPNYADISETLREQRKKSKRDKIRIKEDKAWDD